MKQRFSQKVILCYFALEKEIQTEFLVVVLEICYCLNKLQHREGICIAYRKTSDIRKIILRS